MSMKVGTPYERGKALLLANGFKYICPITSKERPKWHAELWESPTHSIDLQLDGLMSENGDLVEDYVTYLVKNRPLQWTTKLPTCEGLYLGKQHPRTRPVPLKVALRQVSDAAPGVLELHGCAGGLYAPLGGERPEFEYYGPLQGGLLENVAEALFDADKSVINLSRVIKQCEFAATGEDGLPRCPTCNVLVGGTHHADCALGKLASLLPPIPPLPV